MEIFIIYFLGLLSGIVIASIFVFAGRYFGRETEYIFNKFEQKLSSKKAEFFESGNTEQDALEALYEENKKRGLDTQL